MVRQGLVGVSSKGLFWESPLGSLSGVSIRVSVRGPSEVHLGSIEGFVGFRGQTIF